MARAMRGLPNNIGQQPDSGFGCSANSRKVRGSGQAAFLQLPQFKERLGARGRLQFQQLSREAHQGYLRIGVLVINDDKIRLLVQVVETLQEPVAFFDGGPPCVLVLAWRGWTKSAVVIKAHCS